MSKKPFSILIVLFAQTIFFTSATTIYLFNRTVSDFVVVSLSKATSLVNHPYYNISRSNVAATHGFNGSKTGGCMDQFLKGLIAIDQVNVFFIDWSKEAAAGLVVEISYPIAVRNCLTEFTKLGTAFYNMAKTGKFFLNVTTAFGFSLGAHCMGACGRELQQRGEMLDRISGCDPAGVLSNFFKNLNKNDARVVDVLNTDSVTGEYKGIGIANFWPNYGDIVEGSKVQNGCPERDSDKLSPNSVCSHNRAVQLWTYSIKTCIVASRAANYSEWVAGNINGTSCLGYQMDLSANGNYYLNTTACPPYQPDNRTTFYQVSNVTLTQNCHNLCPSSSSASTASSAC